MEKKDLLKKQELAEELGMKFDEASELFSEETLETMRMINVVGGSEETEESKACNCNPKVCNCNPKDCNCNPKHCNCNEATVEPFPTADCTEYPQ